MKGESAMAKKKNCIVNGKEYYRIYRKIGMKQDKNGLWVDHRKAFYGTSQKDAEQKYQEYMKKNSSVDISKRCVGELIDQWADTIFIESDLSEGTKRNYLSAYKNNFRKKPIAGKLISQITALDLQEFYNNNQTEIAYSTMCSLNKFLKKFFKYADLNGYCRDITQSVSVPKKKKMDAEDFDYDISVWEDEDLQKVIRSLEGDRKRLLIVLAANTGARISELLALTYDDIKGNLLYINKQLAEQNAKGEYKFHLIDTKSTSSARVIPLPDKVLEEINIHTALHKEEMIQNNYRTNYLFTTSTGNHYFRRNLQRALERLYKKIDVPYHKFHDYRHTFGTNLSRAGVPIEETSKLMGHSSIEITAKYYINIATMRKLEAVEKITAFSL